MANELQTIQFGHQTSPELKYIRIIGCEAHLLSVLLSSYLYNLVFHSKKNQKSDFQIFETNLQKFFSIEIDKQRIIHKITYAIENEIQDIKDGLRYCLQYCSYCSKSNNDDSFPYLFRNCAGLQSEADICNFFKDTFKVAIKLLRYDGSCSEFNSNLNQKFMILKVYEYQSNFYMTFTQEMIDIENGGRLNEISSLFNSEIYIKSVIQAMPPGPPNSFMNRAQLAPLDTVYTQPSYQPVIVNQNFNTQVQGIPATSQTKINPKTKVSNRYKIENLEVSAEFQVELSAEYSSCVTISDSKNQIRAFAYNLSAYLHRYSRDEYAKTIINSFQNRRTMSELSLKNSISLRNLDYESAVEICEELIKEAASFPFYFPSFKVIKLNEDIEDDFKTIELLSIIFGVTSVVICREEESLTRIILNSNQPSYTAYLHFYATEKERRNFFKVYVIFTRVDEVWDNFDYNEQKAKLKESIMNNRLVGRVDSANRGNEDSKEKLIQFFKSMSDVQNIVLKSVVQSIREKNPVYVNERFNENIYQLKSSYNEIKRIKSISNELGDYELLNISAIDLNTYCHGCSQPPDPQRKNFYSNHGCFFHFECMNKVFKDWYNKAILNDPIEKNEIMCPKCTTKTINAVSFLVLPENVDNLKRFKITAEQKIPCCLCKKVIPFDLSRQIENPHCDECKCKIYFLATCPNCNNPGEDKIDAQNFPATCKACGIQTRLINMRLNPDSHDLKCKRCWYSEVLALLNSGDGQLGQNLLYSVLGNQSVINCEECQNCFLKPLGDFLCESECNKTMCVNCFYSGNDPRMMTNCVKCGMAVLNNLQGIWI